MYLLVKGQCSEYTRYRLPSHRTVVNCFVFRSLDLTIHVISTCNRNHIFNFLFLFLLHLVVSPFVVRYSVYSGTSSDFVVGNIIKYQLSFLTTHALLLKLNCISFAYSPLPFLFFPILNPIIPIGSLPDTINCQKRTYRATQCLLKNTQ